MVEHQFAGGFEVHLTLGPGGDEARLIEWAGAHGARYARILLDRGVTPDQPMLTSTRSGRLDDVMRAVEAVVPVLGSAGFEVVRVKIEAATGNVGVPRTEAEAVALPAGCYFEHHVKLVLSGADEVVAVREVAEGHAAHVSRNVRRAMGDGRHQRFVTQRCRGVGLVEAGRRLDMLVRDLRVRGFPATGVQREFVVHDSRPGLDAGWIAEAGVVVP
jgi:hypothetical protein